MNNDQTQINIGTNYMHFVYKFHEAMVKQKLSLVYEGEVNQAVTKIFASMTESKMEESEDDLTTKKRVYHVMVECLQNICKHADEAESGLPEIPGSGIIMVGLQDGKYVITTGNAVSNSKVEVIRNVLEGLNGLDKDSIKQLYKEKLRDNTISEKGGAGLGFIDIVKKTGNPVEYHFEKINEFTSFFVLKSIVNRGQEVWTH